MKIFCDYHHDELFESLNLLFHDRLGMEIYKPIGLDWFNNKFWDLEPYNWVIESFLCLYEEDARDFLLNKKEGHIFRNQNYNPITKTTTGFTNPKRLYNNLTLEEFKDIKFDLILSSTYNHFKLFENLKNLYQPQAKHIWQAGNNWPIPPGLKNFLNSTTTMKTGPEINSVYYHQEFDISLFRKNNPITLYSIANLMNNLGDQDIETFYTLKQNLKNWSMKAYGATNEHGMLPWDIETISKVFNDNAFIFHVKDFGDGYGYNIHHAIAAGRPIITRRHHYKGMTADTLFIDGISCINLDLANYNRKEEANLILKMVEKWDYYSIETKKHFNNIVNFDEEEKQIRKFLDRLI